MCVPFLPFLKYMTLHKTDSMDLLPHINLNPYLGYFQKATLNGILTGIPVCAALSPKITPVSPMPPSTHNSVPHTRLSFIGAIKLTITFITWLLMFLLFTGTPLVMPRPK